MFRQFAQQAFSALFVLVFSASIQADTHQRIISAGGSITEILDAFELTDRIIAVDTTSVYPPRVHKLPKVGYFRSLGAEGVLSLEPDLLVVARGAGPQAVLKQIEQAGVPVQQFEQSIYTIDSWESLVRDMGKFFDRKDQAEVLINKTVDAIKISQQTQSYTNGSVNAIALLNSGQRGPTAAGKNTMPALLMQLAGLNNLAGDLEGYKPYSPEMLASQKLDLVLVPSHTIEAMGGIEGVCNEQSIKLAMRGECKVKIVDALLLLGFGARIDQALSEVVSAAQDIHATSK